MRRKTLRAVVTSGLTLLAASTAATAAPVDAPLHAIGGFSFDPTFAPTTSDITISSSPVIGYQLVSSGDAQNLYSGAIAEYGLAGIDHARVRSARLIGTVYANNSNDTGVRTMNPYVYRGTDGVITASDVLTPTTVVNPAISYHPPTNASVNFDRDVTQLTRQMRREGTNYFGMAVAAANRQGYSALDSTTDPVRLQIDMVDPALRNIAPVIGGPTGLSFFSEPGHWVGDGTERLFTPADSNITFDDNFDNGIAVSILSGGEHWRLDLSAPNAAQIGVGVYDGATRFGFNDPSDPGLDFFGDGRGLNSLTGKFEVLDIAYDGQNNLIRLDAVFEQIDTDDAGREALYGRVQFNVPEPATAGLVAGVGLLLMRRRPRRVGAGVFA